MSSVWRPEMSIAVDSSSRCPSGSLVAATVSHMCRTITSATKLRKVLAQVREAGYALLDQELEVGLRSIAVPVRDGRGRLIAAMSLAVATSRMTREQVIAQLLPALETARRQFAALL